MSGKRDPDGQDSQCKGSEAGVALAFVKSSEVAHVARREGVRMSKGAEEAREGDGRPQRQKDHTIYHPNKDSFEGKWRKEGLKK